MPDIYYDYREQRYKTVPDCGRYGLTWDERTQRCEYLDCIEIINMNLLSEDYRNYHRDQQMGFAQGQVLAPPSGGGGGIPGIDPISGIVGGLSDLIGGLIAGARQRGSDEARSGVALQASVDSIYYLKELVQSGDSTKREARDAFYNRILPQFYNFILTLTTKSVVESRLNNQVPDLKNLFEKEVMSLSDPVPPSLSDFGVDPQDDVLPDPTGFDEFDTEHFGYTEYYGDDGSYYFEDDSGWYYEDASGNYQYGDSDGNLYAGTSDGEYWEINTDGTSYWESSDGAYYEEYSDGSWISGDALGNECTGDVAGNWTCENGSSGGDWRESPARVIRQTGQTRRQGQITQQSTFDKYLKQAISLIPKQQRQATNQQRSNSAIASRQTANAQQRLIGANPRAASSGGSSMNLLLIGGIAVGAFLILRNR